MSTSFKILLGVITAFLILVIVWWQESPVQKPIGSWQTLPPSKVLETVQSDIIKPPKGLPVYTSSAKSKLILPPEIQKDPVVHVVTAVNLRSNEQDQAIAVLYDENTGKVTTVVEAIEPKLFEFEQRGEAKIIYGVTSQNTKIGILVVHEDFFSIKDIHFGAEGSINTNGIGFAGVSTSYKW